MQIAQMCKILLDSTATHDQPRCSKQRSLHLTLLRTAYSVLDPSDGSRTANQTLWSTESSYILFLLACIRRRLRATRCHIHSLRSA